MSKEIKRPEKSENVVQIAGELLEMNLAVVERENFELVNWKTQERKEVPTCRVITRAEFKNPTLLIGCKNDYNESQVEVILPDVNEFVLSDSGKVEPNPDFKSRETIMANYVCKTSDQAGTRVYIDYATLKSNEYVNKDLEFKTYLPNVTAYNVTSSNVPAEDIFEGKLTGYIAKIIEEVRNEEETGRLSVELYVFEKPDKCFPVTLMVEEDLASDFSSTYSNNDCVSLSYDILKKHVGGKPATTDGRKGRRSSRVTSGFSVTEYSIFDFADEPMDEEYKYFISKAQMKQAKEERDVFIEAAKVKRKEKDSEPKGKKTTGMGGTSTKRQSKIEKVEDNPFADNDSPFVDDDEDIFG